jgi:serine/threonine protein kinase
MQRTAQQEGRLSYFEIIGEIGRGGMGTVYEARDMSSDRHVALKVLAGGVSLTSRAVSRFRREAEAVGKLTHPNIVPIHATGEEGGTYYYAMELVDGPSLDRVIQRMRLDKNASLSEPARSSADGIRAATGSIGDSDGSLPMWVSQALSCETDCSINAPNEVLASSMCELTIGPNYFTTIARMMAEVADALAYAHGEGVIHRDIKPSNLLLSRQGRLSITDFGLARIQDQPGLTMTGEFVGSPLYMSPEQIAVGRAPLDHRTDIYSLGATLYELLAIQPPCPGDRREQVIAQIIHKEPTPPRRLNQQIPVDLETVCLKALEKDPDRRYQAAAEMADDLRRVAEHSSIAARRPGIASRLFQWSRRRPITAMLTGVSIVALAAAAIFAYSFLEARQDAQVSKGQRVIDSILTDVLGGRYEKVEASLAEAQSYGVDPTRIRVLRGLAAVEQSDVATALRELSAAVRENPDSMGAKALLYRAYLEDGQFDRARALLPQLATMTPVTTEDRLYGAWAVSSRWHKQAIEWLEELAGERPTPAVSYLLGMLRTEELLRTYDPTEIQRTVADVSAAKTQMPDNVRAIAYHFHACLAAGDILTRSDNETRAEYYLSEARNDVQLLLTNHSDSGDSHAIATHFAEYEGRWEDALEHIRRAVQLPGLWPKHRFQLPQILYKLGRREEALAALDAMPNSMRSGSRWARSRAFIVAELRGLSAAEETYNNWLPEDRSLPIGRRLGFDVFSFLGRRDRAIEAARDRLREAQPAINNTRLGETFDGYISGELQASDLLAVARKHGQRMRAHYFIGLERLSVGDRAGAVRHFEVIEAAQHYTTSSHQWIYLFLDRMREDPSWPSWIDQPNE